MLFFILFPFFSLFLFGMDGGNNLPVGFAHCIIVKRREVYVCYLFGTVSQAFAYHGNGYSFFFGGGGPTVAWQLEIILYKFFEKSINCGVPRRR